MSFLKKEELMGEKGKNELMRKRDQNLRKDPKSQKERELNDVTNLQKKHHSSEEDFSSSQSNPYPNPSTPQLKKVCNSINKCLYDIVWNLPEVR